MLDRARLERNCARISDVAGRHQVALRPHLKTAKSIEVAHVALGEAAFRGGTVSTIEEAEYFAARGLGDLTYAVGITPDKMPRVRAIGAAIGVITDDLEVARCLPDDAKVWIELDSGQHRGGIDPDGDALLAIGRALGGRLAGVLTHAGHSYARGADLVAVAEQERSTAVRAAERLRASGLACPGVSVGSTPTMARARRLDGVTEIRPGVYMFGDLFQAAIGACERRDLALSVVASVIGRSWIDAGALALTQDRSMEAYGGGYGEVEALDGTPLGRVDRLNQVHGRVPDLELPVGARVRVYPNHACLTAAMFDRYFVLDGDRVCAEWPRLRG